MTTHTDDTLGAFLRYADRLHDIMSTLLAYAATHPARTPAHPSPGCPCTPCIERDEHLEALAEARADERARGVGGAEADRRAGWHYYQGI